MTNPIRIQRLNTLVDDIAATLLTAEYNGQLAGSVELRKISDRSSAFIRLFVHPQFRKLGIGRALVATCEAIASDEHKAETIGIQVRNDQGLETFYRKLRFIVTYQYNDGSLHMCRLLTRDSYRATAPKEEETKWEL